MSVGKPIHEQRWSVSGSGYGAVVSDSETGYDKPEDVEAYGGHLVAESINPTYRPIVAALPEMARLLRRVVRGERVGATSQWQQDASEILERIGCAD